MTPPSPGARFDAGESIFRRSSCSDETGATFTHEGALVLSFDDGATYDTSFAFVDDADGRGGTGVLSTARGATTIRYTVESDGSRRATVSFVVEEGGGFAGPYQCVGTSLSLESFRLGPIAESAAPGATTHGSFTGHVDSHDRDAVLPGESTTGAMLAKADAAPAELRATWPSLSIFDSVELASSEPLAGAPTFALVADAPSTFTLSYGPSTFTPLVAWTPVEFRPLPFGSHLVFVAGDDVLDRAGNVTTVFPSIWTDQEPALFAADGFESGSAQGILGGRQAQLVVATGQPFAIGGDYVVSLADGAHLTLRVAVPAGATKVVFRVRADTLGWLPPPFAPVEVGVASLDRYLVVGAPPELTASDWPGTPSGLSNVATLEVPVDFAGESVVTVRLRAPPVSPSCLPPPAPTVYVDDVRIE